MKRKLYGILFSFLAFWIGVQCGMFFDTVNTRPINLCEIYANHKRYEGKKVLINLWVKRSDYVDKNGKSLVFAYSPECRKKNYAAEVTFVNDYDLEKLPISTGVFGGAIPIRKDLDNDPNWTLYDIEMTVVAEVTFESRNAKDPFSISLPPIEILKLENAKIEKIKSVIVRRLNDSSNSVSHIDCLKLSTEFGKPCW